MKLVSQHCCPCPCLPPRCVLSYPLSAGHLDRPLPELHGPLTDWEQEHSLRAHMFRRAQFLGCPDVEEIKGCGSSPARSDRTGRWKKVTPQARLACAVSYRQVDGAFAGVPKRGGPDFPHPCQPAWLSSITDNVDQGLDKAGGDRAITSQSWLVQRKRNNPAFQETLWSGCVGTNCMRAAVGSCG
jgi:hypothetical protein